MRLAVHVAVRADDFSREEQNALRRKRSRWVIGDEVYDVNPATLIGSEEAAMLRLWSRCKDGKHLPDPGAALDQACINGDAFAIMSAEEHAVLAEERRRQARR